MTEQAPLSIADLRAWAPAKPVSKPWPLKQTLPFAVLVSVGLWIGGFFALQALLKLV